MVDFDEGEIFLAPQKSLRHQAKITASWHFLLDYFRKIIKIILHYTVKIDKLGDVAEGKALMRMGEL